MRKELLRLVLRETLNRNGIPLAWIGADALAATSRGREPGIHVRLMVRHLDSRVMVHAAALQHDFETRLLAMDPLAAGWLMGVSWQFDLPDSQASPTLPHPDSWAAAPVQPAAQAEPARAPSSAQARAELEQLMAMRDAALQQDAETHGASFAPTQPSPL
ncbi:MAG: hypothetical protein HYX47_11255 [Burkholderiales bacterium]|nr:hypothetical protein [Burkholderiales bacterium]